jgi:hypothetical protein
MKGSYLVWDTKTGINDGAYTNLEDAMLRYKQMSADNTNEWLIVQVVVGSKLSNEKFHANKE